MKCRNPGNFFTIARFHYREGSRELSKCTWGEKKLLYLSANGTCPAVAYDQWFYASGGLSTYVYPMLITVPPQPGFGRTPLEMRYGTNTTTSYQVVVLQLLDTLTRDPTHYFLSFTYFYSKSISICGFFYKYFGSCKIPAS